MVEKLEALSVFKNKKYAIKKQNLKKVIKSNCGDLEASRG